MSSVRDSEALLGGTVFPMVAKQGVEKWEQLLKRKEQTTPEETHLSSSLRISAEVKSTRSLTLS